MKKLTQEQVMSLVRHLITLLGGILMTKGLIQENQLQELIGSGVSLTSILWMIYSKKEEK